MESLKNRQILVTGGLGYLGNFLVEKLIDLGANVHVFDILTSDSALDRAAYYNVDLLNYEQVSKFITDIKPDKIFHLAASLDRTRDYNHIDKLFDSNVKGTNNLLRALQYIDYTSFIFSSTGEVYGHNDRVPFTEDMAMQPISPYSVSKAAAELSLQTFSNIYKKPYTILRIFNILGPKLPQHFFLTQLINALKEDKPFNMTKGEQKRDFIFVDDVINAMLVAATNANANMQIFNVCNGNSTTLAELALSCKELLHSGSILNMGALPYRDTEIWNMLGSNIKIKSSLNIEISNLAGILKKCIL